ncbi:FkbM family methyltransferase, partial [Candidatus Pelagibacter sp.]|nr:FkbM family methyltransferase [Candidatus Pelagibacter sp.]
LRNTHIIDVYKINIIKLSDFIKKNNLHQNNFFLKVDTQGNDLEVLLGLEEFINNVKFIKIELPVINLYETSYNYNDINDFMKINKFKPVYLEHLSRSKNAELVEYDVLFEKINK